MGRSIGKAVSNNGHAVSAEAPVAGDILRGDTVSISTAVETHLFESPGALLNELESRGYLWSWGYCTETAQHGMVTWRIVLRAGLTAPPAGALFAAISPQLRKHIICAAGVPKARLHPNTALSITAISPGAVAACRRWLAADFLPRVLPGLLGLSPPLPLHRQGARKPFLHTDRSASAFTAAAARAAAADPLPWSDALAPSD